MAAGIFEDAKAFIQVLKERFSAESSTYKALCTLLSAFRYSVVDIPDLTSELKVLLKGHEDLILEFNNFLPPDYRIAVKLDGSGGSSRKRVSRKVENEGLPLPVKKLLETKDFKVRRWACEEFVSRIGTNLNDDKKYGLFLDAMSDYLKHKDINRLNEEVSSVFKENPEFYIEFTVFLDAIEANPEDEEQGIEVSDGVTKTKPPADTFDFEDDLFEADMIYYGLKSAKSSVERLLKEHEEDPNKEIKVGEFYTGSNLRFIRQFYNRYYKDEDIVELLYKRPVSTSLVFLSRLNQKLGEAKTWRDHQYRKPWAEKLEDASEEARNNKRPVKKRRSSSPQVVQAEASTGSSEIEQQ